MQSKILDRFDFNKQYSLQLENEDRTIKKEIYKGTFKQLLFILQDINMYKPVNCRVFVLREDGFMHDLNEFGFVTEKVRYLAGGRLEIRVNVDLYLDFVNLLRDEHKLENNKENHTMENNQSYAAKITNKPTANKSKYYTNRSLTIQLNVFENEIRPTKDETKSLIRIWTPEHTLMFIVNNNAITPNGKVYKVSLNNLYTVFTSFVNSDSNDPLNFKEIELFELLTVLNDMGLLKRRIREE